MVMSLALDREREAAEERPSASSVSINSELLQEVTEHIRAGMSYRKAVRNIAQTRGLPVLFVRRATREHPAAPLP
jgi:hypothetical protein